MKDGQKYRMAASGPDAARRFKREVEKDGGLAWVERVARQGECPRARSSQAVKLWRTDNA